jgi:D-tyrosyl-tRNA(Tyr) deacylase
VEVALKVVGAIEHGLLVLVGAERGDTADDADAMAKKVAELRIFEDGDGKMNLSVEDVGGAVLVVSQFTLLGDARKGRRPSFVTALEPSSAAELVERVMEGLRQRGIPVQSGRFGASMQVHLQNDGPVTILLDTRKVF